MDPIVVEVREAQVPHAEKGWRVLLKENFVTLLSTVVTIFSGILGYFFVTSFNHQLESSKLALDYLAKTEANALARDRMTLDYRRAELDAFKDSLKNSEIVKQFVPNLLSPKKELIEEAAITLAAAGSSNTPILVAALGNSKQNYGDNVIVGLRISASRSHEETCEALCRYAQQLWPEAADSTSIGNIAKALGDIRCTEARAKLDDWKKRISNGNIDYAIKRLSIAGTTPSRAGYCDVAPR